MKLIRFGAFAAEKPGLILPDGTRADASAFGADYDQAFFANGGRVQLGQWFKKDAASAPRVPSSPWVLQSAGQARLSASG